MLSDYEFIDTVTTTINGKTYTGRRYVKGIRVKWQKVEYNSQEKDDGKRYTSRDFKMMHPRAEQILWELVKSIYGI